ncbi:MAG: ABC transporter substrate-binding protein [Rhodospirillaceae bacterium]|nr:ABC transporter substrate-binding protein [Rhodospirillaceae bacterium]MBT3809724.1 ABC transporter substrate-binding protein [Rhodospirillaceae bacterium]MBT3929958.1 ABC transporter substrate-binding protein [Rhodospirillaceae bacterium]MBT4771745.1 ABC transporter substrate-binding protein [Rhodospirillaceae bacterium]MBT5357927.1 ABC transporter substrate-binding protein [Rhodospirillaceae bacterium]
MLKTMRIAAAIAVASGLAVLAEAQAQPKASLTIGLTLEPPHLDPTAGAAAAIDEIVYANLFEGLTRIDENGAVQPQLAESWDVSDDGLVYTFTLKDGVVFHDGTGFDADDVVFSLDRARADDSVNAQKPLFAAIDAVDAVDARTVRITLSRPEGRLLFNLGWGDAVIVAPESAANNKVAPIGTGPYKFDRWVRGSQIRLVASGDDGPAIRKVTFRFVPDPSAQVAALKAGDIDAVSNLQAPEAVLALQADPNFEVAIGSTEGETILSMNNTRPPLNDIRVRQAIAHAIDRQAIIDGAMFGFGTPIGTHFAPHHPAYVDLLETYPRDLVRARALLADAGQSDLKLTLKLPPPIYARRGGEIVAAQLKEAGITVELIPVEWAQWLEQVFRGTDYDLTIVSHTEPLDIDIYARDSYYFNYDSPDFKALMTRLNNASDPAVRNRILADAQRMITGDAVNTYMFQLAKLGVWRKGLKGMWRNAPVQATDVTGVRWE